MLFPYDATRIWRNYNAAKAYFRRAVQVADGVEPSYQALFCYVLRFIDKEGGRVVRFPLDSYARANRRIFGVWYIGELCKLHWLTVARSDARLTVWLISTAGYAVLGKG